jgi:hypothetical protein
MVIPVPVCLPVIGLPVILGLGYRCNRSTGVIGLPVPAPGPILLVLPETTLTQQQSCAMLDGWAIASPVRPLSINNEGGLLILPPSFVLFWCGIKKNLFFVTSRLPDREANRLVRYCMPGGDDCRNPHTNKQYSIVLASRLSLAAAVFLLEYSQPRYSSTT